VIDRSDFDRLLSANRYLVIATADEAGAPWATPVFFAQLDRDRLCWVSSPDSRHSRNIAIRPSVAVTLFDSTVPVGGAEAAYADAEAAPVPREGTEAALEAINRRLPEGRGLTVEDVHPLGPMVVYVAELRHRYVLVRGGDPDHGNVLDGTFEV
jgi:uncharacterized protein YhbP (UPF0306 family)